MKRFGIVLTAMFAMFAFMAMTSNVQAQPSSDEVNFEFSMTVDDYIETMGDPGQIDFGKTEHGPYQWAEDYEGLRGDMNEWNLAYANCPFRVKIEGDNPAGQGVPRFAREEQGSHGGGFDVLNTVYYIGIITNGEVQNDYFGWKWGIGADDFPKSGNYSETPHNGQVKLKMQAYVNSYHNDGKDNVPIRKTEIDPSFTNEQSADAGEYNASMKITLTALNDL